MSTQIDALPDAPAATDPVETFDAKAFAFNAALQTFRSQTNALGSEMQTNADVAAALITAMALPQFMGTSTSSLAIGTGAKSFATQTSKEWVVGQVVVASSGSNYMKGQVAAYNAGTDVLDVNVTSVNGSGTFASWTIGLSYEGLSLAAAGVNDDITELLSLERLPAGTVLNLPSVGGLFKNLKASASGTSATINISADEIVVENAAGAYFTLRDVAVAASLAASGANGLDDSAPTVVTMTIASPGVITETAHGRPANAPVVLATTGALPTGYTAGTTYYVTNPTTNGYSLSATKGGAAINTTGIQSGVHTVKSVLAVSSWYSKWVIWNGTTTAALLSSSSTNPALPTGYTHKARTGWVYTDSTGNKYPLAFTQFGKRVRYKVAGNVTGYPLMATGAQGNPSTPTWVPVSVSTFIPPTAASIHGTMFNNGGSGALLMVAPNNSHGAVNSNTNPPYASINAATDFAQRNFEMLLESANIYIAGNSGSNWMCQGWEDNL